MAACGIVCGIQAGCWVTDSGASEEPLQRVIEDPAVACCGLVASWRVGRQLGNIHSTDELPLGHFTGVTSHAWSVEYVKF